MLSDFLCEREPQQLETIRDTVHAATASELEEYLNSE